MAKAKAIAALRRELEFARANMLTAWENYSALKAIEAKAADHWDSLILTADSNSPAEIDWRVAMSRTVGAFETYNQARELQLELGLKLRRLEAGQS